MRQFSGQADAAAFIFIFKFGEVALVKNFSKFADDFGIQGIRHIVILSFEKLLKFYQS